MFDRISNSFALARSSWGVLRANKRLVLFPVLSGIACVLVLISFIVPFALRPALFDDLQQQAPWALAKDPTQRRRLDTVLYNQLESLRIIALLIFPFMPHTAASIWRQLGIQQDISLQRLATATQWGGMLPGTQIQPGEQLFPRIDAGRSPTTAESTAAAVGSQTQEDGSVTVSFEEFQRLDLRVGRIVAAEPVPKANKLLKLTVDLGQEQRTVVAAVGLAPAAAPPSARPTGKDGYRPTRFTRIHRDRDGNVHTN